MVGQRAWAIAPLAFACAAAIVPYCIVHHLAAASYALQQGFALVCHQRPERSFWIFGAPVAVCARCLGIYLGAAIGLLLRTSQRLAFRLLLVAASMNLLEALTEVIGLHGNWLEFRFVLGLALGVSAGMLLVSAQVGTTEPSADLAQVPQ